ncbi:MAG TPA: excinuclease ABC subunit UvrC [Candidatus Dormibacteraeota bacterium]|nr:excinuclease ABC subunit UvrC [Candidatus Dormibacteraeota bacterium]
MTDVAGAAAPSGEPRHRLARLIDNAELLRTRLRDAPEAPGVYLMRDLEARVAYVGKAQNLRNRLRSYFSGIESLAPRTRQLVERVFDFEVLICASPREALLLENQLIKRYRPRFNVRLKDDKSYLYLKIPRPGQADAFAPGTAREVPRVARGRPEARARAAQFPRPYYSRRMHRDGARYFGPYTSAQSLRTTVKSLRTVFPFRTCGDEVFKRGRVCLDYHIKRCSGPCEGHISPEDYAALLEQVELFMHGRSATLTAELTARMREAAATLDYEAAARYRDRLRAVDRLRERQAMVSRGRDDRDAVGVALDGTRGVVAVVSVREGKVTQAQTHALEGVGGLGRAESLESFIGQYYGDTTSIPRSILVREQLSGRDVLQEFLTDQRGGPVEIRVPQRGHMRELVDQAVETAEIAVRQARIEADFDSERTEALLADLADRLGLREPPRRIECYDISNTMGTNSVGSMVVFEDGRPRPQHYRHFLIKTVEGANDFASMQETLRRRFGRHLRTIAEAVGGAAEELVEAALDEVPVEDPGGTNGGRDRPEADDADAGADAGAEEGAGGVAAAPRRTRTRSSRIDDSFLVLPDLVIIDGGRGQLNAALEVLAELGLGSVPAVGLAKQNEEIVQPGRDDPLVIPRDSPTLFLVQRVRDEAHRFAITRHRARRGREALRSRLDVVSGLGPARKRALLRHFGSVDGIREADVDEISAVPGVPRSVALRIKELL